MLACLQCAHIMAMAVQRLHKGAQVGLGPMRRTAPPCRTPFAWPTPAPFLHRRRQVTIGPWTERGFFYDFDMPQPLTERDLPKIRKEMQRILKKNLPFVREEVPAEEARRRIQARGLCPARPPSC